ncbi:triose-phosphate isomerase [Ahrensia marina]|uniref:Triosephosphate isomerase n=1 Tax=Ahrensia marina TaxID=1514904 RepID=A0A0M9GN53_9HYPH|nr:triose-phosphate isomerase [Ahrensia marina]KPB01399.1 triosephosphate isomerase [Ahrensia marina]
MTTTPKPLIAGNWKMNGVTSGLTALRTIAEGVSQHTDTFDGLICLPATMIERGTRLCNGTALLLGGQDCHFEQSGAHTGDISADMLQDAGASYVILGHSERRADHDETNTDVLKKSLAAYETGLTAIICVGETRAEREEGRAMEIVSNQLEGSMSKDANSQNTVIAYEPVWAIGTGLVPSNHDIEAMHGHIRQVLSERFGVEGESMRILYGGSLKPSNAEEILRTKNVNGGLIGGASLKSEDFLAICAAVPGN